MVFAYTFQLFYIIVLYSIPTIRIFGYKIQFLKLLEIKIKIEKQSEIVGTKEIARLRSVENHNTRCKRCAHSHSTSYIDDYSAIC